MIITEMTGIPVDRLWKLPVMEADELLEESLAYAVKYRGWKKESGQSNIIE